MILKFVMQIDTHVGGVNDIAFSHPNKQLCVITFGDDKTTKVFFFYMIFLHVYLWNISCYSLLIWSVNLGVGCY